MDGSSYETELPALFLASGREEGPKWHLEGAESECLKALALTLTHHLQAVTPGTALISQSLYLLI